MGRISLAKMVTLITNFLPLLLLLLLLLSSSNGLPDGLHPTPPMGWTSWNTFFENNTEQKMISQVDALLSLGLDSFGYNTLTIDDFWQLPERDASGRMVPDPEKFPNGIKYLADYFHERGLRLGIYSSAGRFTCSGNLPGSLGHEREDVASLVEWEIDYFKYDNCYPRIDGTTNIGGTYIDFQASAEHYPSLWQDPSEESRYAVMASELDSVRDQRNITFELCAWGFGNVETFGGQMGHLWRTSQDMTDTGYQSMFALWCLVKAPLMLGADLRTITRESEAYKIITNPDLLAVNQDPLGVQGECVKDCCSHGPTGGLTSPQTCFHFNNSWQVWAGPLEGDAWVVVVLNRFDKEEEITVDWAVDAKIPEGSYQLRDLWHGEDLQEVKVGGLIWEGSVWKGVLAAHANWAFKLTPVLV